MSDPVFNRIQDITQFLQKTRNYKDYEYINTEILSIHKKIRTCANDRCNVVFCAKRKYAKYCSRECQNRTCMRNLRSG